MMRPQLTNEQRIYLGLRPVLPHWQANEWLPNTVFYHDEAAIYKIARYYPSLQPDNFEEADYTIALTAEGLMLPKSGRGKPRPVTAANLEKYLPSGCRFWYDGAGRFLASAPYYAFIPVKGRGDYGNWAAVSAWLDQWLARQPADLPQQWTARLAAPVPAIAYQAGDVVAFSFSNGEGYGFCRILLDTNRLDEAGWLRDPPAYTGGFHYLRRIVAPLLLAEVLDLRKAAPYLTAPELAAAARFPPLLLGDGGIFRGCLPIVAHQPVEAAHLQLLPEAFEVLYQGGLHGYHYQWGITSVVALADEWLAQAAARSRDEFPRRLRPLADFEVESVFLDPEKHFRRWPDGQVVAPHDLRHPRYQELKAHLLRQLNLPATSSYDEFSCHAGYPTRQELLDLQARLPFNRRKWRWWW